jgi:hypothetical protein
LLLAGVLLFLCCALLLSQKVADDLAWVQKNVEEE